MSEVKLRRVSLDELEAGQREAFTAQTLSESQAIVDDVRARGELALMEHARRLGDLTDGPLIYEREALNSALASVPGEVRELLERTADRIRRFAVAQQTSLRDVVVEETWGRMGIRFEPLRVAGCYAPGGRYPLPSSVLMTAITARVAGVSVVQVASPRPTAVTLAAAALAGADRLLAVGGAQAIAGLAQGIPGLEACDILVGPGNAWVTAAKYLVSNRVRIDMLAGPSELVVFADASASAQLVAADLLAQAEHDPLALPILVTTRADLIAEVEVELGRQLPLLATSDVAGQALSNAFAVLVSSVREGVEAVERLAPEHLELMLDDAETVARRIQGCGAIFIGAGAAEVLGDYGAGPNHVLPTGGQARTTSGLSVLNFMRTASWMEVKQPQEVRSLVRDAVALAQLEGLPGHAHSAALREKLLVGMDQIL